MGHLSVRFWHNEVSVVVPLCHGVLGGRGSIYLIQKLRKIDNIQKSFNILTIESSHSSCSTFLHTTCLRFQLPLTCQSLLDCSITTSIKTENDQSRQDSNQTTRTQKDTHKESLCSMNIKAHRFGFLLYFICINFRVQRGWQTSFLS